METKTKRKPAVGPGDSTLVRFKGLKVSREPRKKKRMPRRSSPLPVLAPRPPPPHHLYIPQLHREETALTSLSPLGSALAIFSQKCVMTEMDPRAKATAHQELQTIIDLVFPILTRNTKGIRFRHPVIRDGFAHWQTRDERRLVCVLPMEIPGMTTVPQNPGSAFILFPTLTGDGDPRRKLDLISDEFRKQRFVSSQKLYHTILKMVGKNLISKRVPEQRLCFSSTQRFLEIRLEHAKDWVAEIVPCLTVEGSGTIYCCKSFYQSAPNEFRTPRPGSRIISPKLRKPQGFLSRETPAGSEYMSENATPIPIESPSSWDDGYQPPKIVPEEQLVEHPDISWYASCQKAENSLIQKITKTDNGIRMCAMQITHRMCQNDWRLADLNLYQIQTVMLYDTDHQLDHSPRWQRDMLEHCTRSILGKLGDFAKQKKLPHFFVQGVNLWRDIQEKRLNLMSGAIDRLASSDIALTALVCRTGGFTLTPEAKLFNPFLSPRHQNFKDKTVRVSNHFRSSKDVLPRQNTETLPNPLVSDEFDSTQVPKTSQSHDSPLPQLKKTSNKVSKENQLSQSVSFQILDKPRRNGNGILVNRSQAFNRDCQNSDTSDAENQTENFALDTNPFRENKVSLSNSRQLALPAIKKASFHLHGVKKPTTRYGDSTVGRWEY